MMIIFLSEPSKCWDYHTPLSYFFTQQPESDFLICYKVLQIENDSTNWETFINCRKATLTTVCMKNKWTWWQVEKNPLHSPQTQKQIQLMMSIPSDLCLWAVVSAKRHQSKLSSGATPRGFMVNSTCSYKCLRSRAGEIPDFISVLNHFKIILKYWVFKKSLDFYICFITESILIFQMCKLVTS